ncbi:MAG: 23S rRNA (pseudouridine(1915)-N(3))-methyltransferase RlmH [Lachnospiraceae bacterium]|nr:23S rRNA (pseudouridine(1915)-N(3))-methyltransferase RlmH [Lachnospiraceae bacterium]
MNINILCAGRIREKYLKDAVDEYSKRLSKFAKLTITEVADEKEPNNASDADRLNVINTEGERLFSKIPERSYVIALAIDGKRLSSEGFAEKIERTALSGCGSITFIIGGSLGLSEKVLKRADMKLSFSDMTFPHQLMRVILLEQIYRAYKIINNEPYHK